MYRIRSDCHSGVGREASKETKRTGPLVLVHERVNLSPGHRVERKSR